MIPTPRALLLAVALGAGALLTAAPAHAQSLYGMPETPALSLGASASQTVGVTEVSIAYSSPAARGREIWGGLVPYGELWRAGANSPTKVTFDRAVTVGGSEVAPGSYTLIVLPTADTWTFILNTDSAGRGAFTHDEKEDVARVDVKPVDGQDRERLLYLFEDTTNTSTNLTLEWAGKKAALPITTDTGAFVEANIKASLESLWRPAYSAARYLLDNEGDLTRASDLMASSIAIQSNWWNQWFMAKIQHERGEHKAAKKHVKEAIKLGEGDGTFEGFFRGQAEAALKEWPAK